MAASISSMPFWITTLPSGRGFLQGSGARDNFESHSGHPKLPLTPFVETIGDREVYLARSASEVSIVVNRGGYESLPEHTVQRIKALFGD